MCVRLCFLLSVVFLVSDLSAQANGVAFRRAQHLRHGINMSEWFSQAAPDPQRLATYTTADDIALVKRLGFDHVRMPVDPAIFLECRGAWEQCDNVKLFDAMLKKALSEDLAVIVDIHPSSEYKKQVATDGDAVQKFGELWRHIAAHYKAYDPERVFFEVMNEPEDGDAYHWNGVQERMVHEIHLVAPEHTVVVAGTMWSDIWNLAAVQKLADANVIYNFHYYEPHIFTHQGAGWSTARWRELEKIPYPATEENLGAAEGAQTDEVVRWDLLQYRLADWSAARFDAEMRFAADWAKRNGVPLIANEFGAYRNTSNPADRYRWIHDVRSAFEKNGIGWTMWDYRGSFGVVHRESGSPVVDDGVVQALGLKR